MSFQPVNVIMVVPLARNATYMDNATVGRILPVKSAIGRYAQNEFAFSV